MNFHSLINSRHRGDFNYYLNLNSTLNNDYIEIPFSELDCNVPATGDFYFEATFKVPPIQARSLVTIFGRAGASSLDLWSYSFQLRSNGALEFQSYGTRRLVVASFTQTYLGQVLTVKGVYNDGGVELYINDVRITFGTSTRPIQDLTEPFLVNKFGSLDLAGANVEIHSFNINGVQFDCNEGSGFNVIGSGGEIGTGSTSNAAGINYWDPNVWKKIV